jgi:hypothetical protein
LAIAVEDPAKRARFYREVLSSIKLLRREKLFFFLMETFRLVLL